jgi:methylmalonyl-CoA mutase cobalamin-binding domain/chain
MTIADQAAVVSSTHPPPQVFATPIRLLTAVPICDGHDSAINTINLELIRHGVEVIYLGYHRPAADIVRAAIQEDVRAIGLSSYNGGHIEFFAEVRQRLDARGGSQVGLFGGGGGTITQEDAEHMLRQGTDRIFFPGTPLSEMVDWIKERYGGPHKEELNPDASYIKGGGTGGSRDLARRLSHAETRFTRPVGDPLAEIAAPAAAGQDRCRVVGLTGPGGAGKTTLIDELVLRFLRARPADARIAILSHDPSIGGAGAGALLGDRATMIYSQDDRVFMRSMATRGQSGGLSPATGRCLEILANSGKFDLVIIETVGTGQEALPFSSDLVDLKILVMNPDYGSRLQLQKIAMLDAADLVIVNKSDLRGARTATAEIEARLASNKRGQRLLATTATRHRDAGVDAVYALLQVF